MFYNKLNKEESKDWGGGGQMRYLDPTQQYQEEEEASACLPGHTRSKKKVYHTHNNKGEERGRRRLNYRELVYCTWFECRPKTRPNVSGRLLLLLLFHINCWSMSARWPISVVCTAPWPIFESLCVLLNMWRGWRARGGGEGKLYHTYSCLSDIIHSIVLTTFPFVLSIPFQTRWDQWTKQRLPHSCVPPPISILSVRTEHCLLSLFVCLLFCGSSRSQSHRQQINTVRDGTN